MKICNISDSYGGSAWCMDLSPRHSMLVIGCDDGSARSFSYDMNVLSYKKAFATTGSRILSIAFHPANPRLFFGCADGTIRCVDEVNYST